MKTWILVALAAISLGAGVANAQPETNGGQQQGNNYNWTAGGGG
ncbi:MAG: hypothetical protein P4L90_23080 [Rhodopila sp.]|nr:hypothetical protein [Rhodopila sp.]